ncbi:MAG TPA: PIG-L family deacetylase [Terriglobia bacterium]|nr:PIG-L family deacetylase [Terriglobia bacterium]
MRSAKLIVVVLTIFCALPLILLSTRIGAQSPRAVSDLASTYPQRLAIDRGAAGLWQTLKKLHTRASLIMFTAHPDDEDGGTLAYESRGLGARVAVLTLNRGEGGANVMSPDYFDALGLVRTQELLAADRYYGVQEYFTRVCDYGFSKTLEEAEEKWTTERVLYDAVRVIRMTRPLVVTSVFVGGPSDGHGNHQMAGMVAQLAYKEAGDPNVFPDQIRAGLRPWKPLKDYARVPFMPLTSRGIYDYASHRYYPLRFHNYVTGRWTEGSLETTLEIPEGSRDPLLGLSFLQIAREGLGFQKSQNGGTGAVPWNPFMSGYHRFASRIPTGANEKSFFDGVDVSLTGIAKLAPVGDTRFLKNGLRKINGFVEEAVQNFSAENPAKIVPELAQGSKEVSALIAAVSASSLSSAEKYNVDFELKVKRAQFNTALCEALGLSVLPAVAPAHPPTGLFAIFMGTLSPFRVALRGGNFKVKVHVANQGPDPVELTSLRLTASSGPEWPTTAESATSGTLAPDTAEDANFDVQAPGDAPYTRPYFTRPNIEQAYYDISNPEYLNLPLPPYPLAAVAQFSYDGVPLRISQVVQTAERATGPGLVLQPLVVAPAISVWLSPHAGVTPLSSKSFVINATVHSNVKGRAQGVVRLDLPKGWKASAAQFSTSKDGQDQTLAFRVYPNALQERPYTITADAQYNGQDYKEGYRTVGYPGLRPYFLYRPATFRTTGVNVKVAQGLNIGYVMGTGDDVPQSLGNLDLKVHFLTSQDLATGDLSKYNIILMGVRTYAVRDDLRTYNGRILNYVKNGGVVVVQYNTPEFDHDYGPYPYAMTNDPEEVTDEDSKIVILDSNNPVFTWPNKITTADFDGWVEERGSKFMKTWDPHYEPLLETHDPGQAPQKGGLLYARYGKGIYIYNAYAFYRQLPEGAPGAYRIFANMLSLPKNPNVK